MRRPARPGFWLVVRREWRWITRDRAAPILIFAVPLLAFIILSAVFSQQVIRGLGVVLVDNDRSQTSSIFVQALAAAPGLSIVRRSDDLSAAASTIRSGDAIAAVYIPPDFERDLTAARRPQVVAFYNQELLTAAGIAASSLSDALQAAADSVAPAARAAPAARKIGSLAVEQIALVNPERNYAQFLLRAVLPTVLHIVIALGAGYSVGSEFRRRSMRAWLACAGGRPIVALAGKLAPLHLVFTGMLVLLALILEGLFGIRFRGDLPMMFVAGQLFIIAYLAVGALFQLVTRDLLAGLSMTSLFASPAFGYAGVGFPIFTMNAFAQGWSAILPLRWYLAVLFGQAARGLPPADSAPSFAALAGLCLLYSLLALLLLKRAFRKIPTGRPQEAAPIEAAPGIAGAFVAEWRRVLSFRPAFGLLVMAAPIYGAFYPQPYLTQILREIPIAVVDNDLSHMSLDVLQTLDASGTLKVVLRADTLGQAKRAIDRGEVFAIVGIPPGTERDVLKGVTARLPVYADATYLLVFKAASSGIAAALASLSADIAAGGARADGSLSRASLASLQPADILIQPIFNPVGGYASYVVPAAFALILQQPLLMAAAMLTGLALASASARPFATVVGRAVAHLVIYLPALALFLIVLPHLYGFSTLGSATEIFLFAVPFVLATSFLGQAVGAFFRRQESSLLAFLAFGLPLFFLVGYSWPREAMPAPVLAAARVIPSELAIDGLVRLNQMGASLSEVARDWHGLWILTACYFALAWLSARRARRSLAHD